MRIDNTYRIAWTYDFLGRIATLDTQAGQVRYEHRMGQAS